MKGLAAFLTVLLLSSAGTVHAKKLKNLKPPASATWFWIGQEHVRIERRGKKQTPFVTFLSAGIYRSVAEDDEGTYYLGPIDCIQLISGIDAEKYLSSSPRQRPPKNTSFGEWAIKGGLRLPKPGAKSGAQLFYDIGTEPKNHAECSVTPGCIPVLGRSVEMFFSGSLSYKDFSSEAAFIASLEIRSGEPPAN